MKKASKKTTGAAGRVLPVTGAAEASTSTGLSGSTPPSDDGVTPTIRDIPAGQRRVGRARAEGIASLDDTDLVAILLGTGTAGRSVAVVANDLLERMGGLQGLSRLGPTALADHAGLSLAKAVRLAASLELGRRSFERTARPREPLRHPSAVAGWFASRLGGLDHEEMWVVALDGRNGMRGTRRVSQGGLHGCSVTARDILRLALADAATAIVLIHNHPSGDPSPSTEDLIMTKTVVTAAAVVGTPLVDHVIVTRVGRYISLRDIGALGL